MLTPAQRYLQREAARRGVTPDSREETRARTAHEQVLHQLRMAQMQLKGVQSNIAKAELKNTFYRILKPGLTAHWQATADARTK